MHKIKTIYVEGNVGCGKSTFLSILKEHLDVQILYEPVELWQNIDGHNLLEKFFADQQRWAFTLQMYVTVTRIDQLQEAVVHNHGRVQCVERSVFSNRYCFAKNLFEMGIMSDLEWVLYQKLWDRDVNNVVAEPAGFIYLQVPAEICLQRINHRHRMEEQPISLQYLKSLEKNHDDLFLHTSKVPVLVLDASVDIVHDKILQQEYVNQVRQFIKQL